MNADVTCVVDLRSPCGEGPLWSAEEGVLYWVDLEDPMVHAYDPATGVNRTWPVAEPFGAIALRARGGFVAAMRRGFAFLDPQAGTITPIAPLADTTIAFNDATCDRAGRFWAGAYHTGSPPAPVGGVYRLDADLASSRQADGIRVSNGLGFSPDGRTFYLTDTPAGVIYAYDADRDDGTIRNRRVFATVPSSDGRPDGLTVDADGCVWSAHWAGWRVTRYDPRGRIDRVLRLPVANCSSCAFGGGALDTLYVTTAIYGLDATALVEQPLAGSLFAATVGARGLPEPRFAG